MRSIKTSLLTHDLWLRLLITLTNALWEIVDVFVALNTRTIAAYYRLPLLSTSYWSCAILYSEMPGCRRSHKLHFVIISPNKRNEFAALLEEIVRRVSKQHLWRRAQETEPASLVNMKASMGWQSFKMSHTVQAPSITLNYQCSVLYKYIKNGWKSR